jgi:hypothetical protein
VKNLKKKDDLLTAEKEAFMDLKIKLEKTEFELTGAYEILGEKKRNIQMLEKEKKDLKYKIEDLLAESVSLYNSEEDDDENKLDDSEEIMN